jgi:hypothetical protein
LQPCPSVKEDSQGDQPSNTQRLYGIQLAEVSQGIGEHPKKSRTLCHQQLHRPNTWLCDQHDNITWLAKLRGSNNSYKPITNTAWVRAQLCKLQKGCTRLAAASDKVYQLFAQGRWFSPSTPASSTTKTGRHYIAEILLKVALLVDIIDGIITMLFALFHEIS